MAQTEDRAASWPHLAFREQKFRILVVCTGNICRSPIAEALLTAQLGDAVSVSSAGTNAVVGAPMEPFAAAVLGELGYVADPDFRARQLEPEHAAAADLVVTMSRGHRSYVVSDLPTASVRTFTLQEMARLLSAAGSHLSSVPDVVAPAHVSGSDRMRAVVAAAAARRGLVRADHPGQDDIADPYRQPLDVFRRAGHEIAEAVRVVAAALLTTSFVATAVRPR